MASVPNDEGAIRSTQPTRELDLRRCGADAEAQLWRLELDEDENEEAKAPDAGIRLKITHAYTNESLWGNSNGHTKTIHPPGESASVVLRPASDRYELWTLETDVRSPQERQMCLVGGMFGKPPLAHPSFTHCKNPQTLSTPFERWIVRCAGGTDQSDSER